jgi:hypothetical protein
MLLAFECFDPQLLRSLLDVVDGSPIEQLLRRRVRLRQQEPQGGKVETHSDLVMDRELVEEGEVVIAVARRQRNQEQQSTSQKR